MRRSAVQAWGGPVKVEVEKAQRCAGCNLKLLHPRGVRRLPIGLVADCWEGFDISHNEMRKGRGVDFDDDRNAASQIGNGTAASILAAIEVTKPKRFIHPDLVERRSSPQQFGDDTVCRSRIDEAFDALAAGRLVEPIRGKNLKA